MLNSLKVYALWIMDGKKYQPPTFTVTELPSSKVLVSRSKKQTNSEPVKVWKVREGKCVFHLK